MAETIALVSVIVSGVTALGGLWLGYRNGERQRRHEADLSHTARTWDRKADGLLEVLRLAQRLKAWADGNQRTGSPFNLAEEELTDMMATVHGFASDECREALTELLDVLGRVEYDERLRAAADEARAQAASVEHRIVSQRERADFSPEAAEDERVAAHVEVARAMSAYQESARVNDEALRAALDRLVSAARADLNRDTATAR